MSSKEEILVAETSTSRGEQNTIGVVIDNILSSDERPKVDNRFHKFPENNFMSGPLRGTDIIKTFEKLRTFDGALPRELDLREEAIKKRTQKFIGSCVTESEFEDLHKMMDINEKLKIKRVISADMPDEKNIMDHVNHTLPKESELKSIEHLKNEELSPHRHNLYHKYSGVLGPMHRSFMWQNVSGKDDLVPGEIVLYYVRVYKPFAGIIYGRKNMSYGRSVAGGMSAQQEIILLGHHDLTYLRDSIKCPNDYGPRTDISDNPNQETVTYLRNAFPSGFLFISDVFYNDMREANSIDYSANIREWAKKRNIADLPARLMTDVTLDDLEIRMGHPEVYVHQGNCEHVFTFTQIRLLNPADVCVSSFYPHAATMAASRAQLCIMCGTFNAQWAVVAGDRIPFDPAHLCRKCFLMYNYVDGVKVGQFKAYRSFDRNHAFYT